METLGFDIYIQFLNWNFRDLGSYINMKSENISTDTFVPKAAIWNRLLSSYLFFNDASQNWRWNSLMHIKKPWIFSVENICCLHKALYTQRVRENFSIPKIAIQIYHFCTKLENSWRLILVFIVIMELT